MSIFELDVGARRALGAECTTQEILQQPRLWQEIATPHARQQPALQAFLGPLLRRPELRIVLTGAGTSAFVGECLRAPLALRTGRRVEAIATTDLVAAPRAFLEPDTPTLLVSFARSGDSPESVASFDLADRHVSSCAQLVVTCNPDGALLARAHTHPYAHSILLPAAANDRGFAMTSSFTGMMLASALAFGVLTPVEIAGVASLGTALCHWLPRLESFVGSGFERAVFLGSNVLKGLAREAALKLLELTDGRVVAVGESPLGFRHGPKTILNSSTLVIVLLSNDPHARRYDLDLLAELRREGVASRVLSLSGWPTSADAGSIPTAQPSASPSLRVESGDDLILPVPAGSMPSDLALCLPFAMWAQSLALLRSLSLGLRPDRPHAAGTVSRVVEGVTIHPYEAK